MMMSVLVNVSTNHNVILRKGKILEMLLLNKLWTICSHSYRNTAVKMHF